MAEGNGEIPIEEVPGKDSDVGRTPDYRKLIDYGLDPKVAAKLDDIYKTGKLAHAELDERALDALKEFPSDGALSVLGQFLDSNLEHVSNKSAYLCGVMKTYRQKSRAGVQGAPALSSTVQVKGPDEEKIKQILARTGYTLDVTTGQRKYGGPPPGWEGGTPGAGCEVFCGKIPKDMYEDELIPLFERCGTIWDLRLMMDPMTGTNRGYAFVTFTTREATQRAVQELDNHEIKPGKTLRIKISVPNLRLFVGNIPKSKGKEEILEEFGKLTAGLVEVIIYSSPDDKKKNRGFCFLEYESHKAASLAKRRLGTGRIKQVWGCDIIVDWADPQEEPDEQTMSKVKVLYARNLTQEITEDALKEEFERYGTVERVKKIKDYAFVHFEDRDCAVKAMQELDGKEMGGARLEVSLAKPPSDKKKKEEILRARERRMMQMIHGRGGLGHVGRAGDGRGARRRRRPPRLGPVVVRAASRVAAARPAPCVAIPAPSQVYQVNVNTTGATRTSGGSASGGWARAGAARARAGAAARWRSSRWPASAGRGAGAGRGGRRGRPAPALEALQAARGSDSAAAYARSRPADTFTSGPRCVPRGSLYFFLYMCFFI
ncbi:heterogeneous nuclear ribonucleoprotein R-like isoform X4 [Helicoverpa zea]|uniref:heterogeneous nuclear ribonucleoprotein R-like isoform X4 n=1 Tax=Helicoverpa zea TaxID=7113 RepID=UPI001F595E3C|nr:heterogeneous nuclear ribonucleoprotein R-like isoform X4 [Helicoverpa zea]